MIKSRILWLLLAVVVCAFVLPVIESDGSENFSDIHSDVVGDVFSKLSICRHSFLGWKLMVLRSKLIRLNVDEALLNQETEAIEGSGRLAVTPSKDFTYTAILRNYSFFAIPRGFTKVTQEVVSCNADINLESLR